MDAGTHSMEAHLTLEPSEFIIEQLRHDHGFVNAHYRFVNAHT
jgi:hypothetical protein